MIKDLQKNNQSVIEYFLDDLVHYYTGRATPVLLDNIRVKYYDELVPLDHCASVTVKSAEMLLVMPYERSLAKDIERAIHQANTGLNPQADGDSIKVYLPRRTKESDQKIFKLIKERAEKARVSIRHNRQKARDKISGDTKDEQRRLEKQIQDDTDKSIARINEILENKRKELRV